MYLTLIFPNTKKTLTELEQKIESNVIMVGYFNISLSVMNNKARQNINKGTRNFNAL